MKISITLPSIYPDALHQTIDIIRKMSKVDNEILVVSPFDPSPCDPWHSGVWIVESEPRGIAFAHARAAAFATGDFIIPFADDHRFVEGWDEIAISNFMRQERDQAFALGLRCSHSGHVGTEFGIYYPYFPMMRLEAMRKVGGWITGDYQRGFGDSDLAMRVWAAGGRCEWSDIGLLWPSPDDKRKPPGPAYTEADMALFLSRWAPRYGGGWDTSRIELFNIDLDPGQNQDLVDGNTVFYNDPSFLQRVTRMPS